MKVQTPSTPFRLGAALPQSNQSVKPPYHTETRPVAVLWGTPSGSPQHWFLPERRLGPQSAALSAAQPGPPSRINLARLWAASRGSHFSRLLLYEAFTPRNLVGPSHSRRYFRHPSPRAARPASPRPPGADTYPPDLAVRLAARTTEGPAGRAPAPPPGPPGLCDACGGGAFGDAAAGP